MALMTLFSAKKIVILTKFRGVDPLGLQENVFPNTKRIGADAAVSEASGGVKP